MKSLLLLCVVLLSMVQVSEGSYCDIMCGDGTLNRCRVGCDIGEDATCLCSDNGADCKCIPREPCDCT